MSEMLIRNLGIASLLAVSLPVQAETNAVPAGTTNTISFTSNGQQLNQLAARGVALVDLNGDGFLDAFVVNQNTPDGQGHRLYLGDGHGHFTDSGQLLANPSDWYGQPAIGDINGDGKPDAITGRAVWINDGPGRLTAHTKLIEGAATDNLTVVRLADLNGDGSLDLFFILKWKVIGVFLNDGKGSFRDTRQNFGHSWADELAIGDLDGDGTADILLACGFPRTGTPNEVWLNDGKGNFRDSGLRLAHGFSSSVAMGDLNGDGKLDAVVADLRLVDGSKNPPIFGGAPLEVWLNATPTAGSAKRKL